MKYSREIEHAVLDLIRGRLEGQTLEHEDSHTNERELRWVGEITTSRYYDEPCLVVRLNDQDGEKTDEVIIRAGFTED